ncbi:MAG: pyridoxamine 5'-phosphate oxidase family protein [Syntrophobacteraceae bacterium]|nr:pyridoxamine 5'-phosphate oxidase family protein [Syntrophobacteraceae bacterium]
MNSAYEYLKANPVFHLATVDEGKGRVRPFGFIMKRNDLLYFCTNTTKDVYKQLVANPQIEISDKGTDDTWLRVRGSIAFDESREAKEQAFAEAPDLLRIYPKGAEEKTFITFHFVDAKATLYSFSQPPKTLPLL